MVNEYGRLCLPPAGIKVSYLVAVKLRTIAMEGWAPSGNCCKLANAPPTNDTVTGSASLLVKSSIALVACPLMTFTPKTSADGNLAETETAILGATGGVWSFSSACNWVMFRLY